MSNYLVDASAQTRLAPGPYLQIQGKRCELRLTNNDKIECDLNSNSVEEFLI